MRVLEGVNLRYSHVRPYIMFAIKKSTNTSLLLPRISQRKLEGVKSSSILHYYSKGLKVVFSSFISLQE